MVRWRGPSITSTRALTRILIGLLAAHVGLAWMTLAGVALLIERVWYGLAGRVLRSGTLGEHVQQLETIRMIQGVLWLVTAAVFLSWVHRVYRGAGAHVPGRLGYSPRWAVGAFLVPPLNLIHPLHVMNDLWPPSPASEEQASGRKRRLSPWLVAWWLTLLCALLADPFPLRLVESIEARLDFAGGMHALVLGALAEMASGVLAIVVVARVAGGVVRAEERRDLHAAE